ncbi:MAG: HK97 family phage prohead protease [Clostridium sp.]
MKIKNRLFVTRSFDVNNFETVEDEGRIKGHAAVFNQRTNIGNYFYEIVERGAFDECDLSDVMLHVNHNTSKIPLARARRSKPTMTVGVDDTGLAVNALLDIEGNAESRAVYNAIKRHDLDGMSFAFVIQEQRWENLDTKMPTRRITKIRKVTEVSVVNRPAYTGASVSARSTEPVTAREELQEARNVSLSLDNQLELEKIKIKIKNM